MFKRDPLAALNKVLAARAADEAKLVELRQDRAAKLVESDDVAVIEAIDRKIAGLGSSIRIHADRIGALQAECQKLAAEQREQKRDAAIKVIEKKLAAREAVAAELEASIKKTGDLFFELLGQGSITLDWPFGAPKPNFGVVDVDGIRREVGWALFSAGRPRQGKTIFPGPNNIGLGVTGVSPLGLAAHVAAKSSALLMLLREMPLDDEPAEDEVESVSVRGFAELATA
jgi:hypothetical protein